jgi:hypothetical protein
MTSTPRAVGAVDGSWSRSPKRHCCTARSFQLASQRNHCNEAPALLVVVPCSLDPSRFCCARLVITDLPGADETLPADSVCSEGDQSARHMSPMAQVMEQWLVASSWMFALLSHIPFPWSTNYRYFVVHSKKPYSKLSAGHKLLYHCRFRVIFHNPGNMVTQFSISINQVIAH